MTWDPIKHRSGPPMPQWRLKIERFIEFNWRAILLALYLAACVAGALLSDMDGDDPYWEARYEIRR